MISDHQNNDAATGLIYPEVRHPYYIVAPPYARTSAGVRVLHLLCHSLNRLGHTAYILLHPAMPSRHEPIAPDLMTPVLTHAVIRNHCERGLTPIMVYPEIIVGNPFGAPCVVRYVLNFPGLLGGEAHYARDELCFSYSQILAASTPQPGNVLFLPATDTRIFRPPPQGQKRQGTCFYAHKYKTAHQGKLFDITEASIEITRDNGDSQTPEQLANLFQRSEIFYTYENTALAIEAVLCGCPAVFLPNPYLSDMIAIKELGQEGYAWGADPSEIARAKATVGQGAANYIKTYGTYWRELDRFIALSQQHAEGNAYKDPVRLPGIFDTLGFAMRHGYRQGAGKIWRSLRASAARKNPAF